MLKDLQTKTAKLSRCTSPCAHITLNPIDTTALRLPADLRGKPLDDPQVIARYNKALEYVLSRVPKIELVGLAIGNEIDGYLGADKKKWKQYRRFFKATSAHARRIRPGLLVGTKVMLPSVVGGIQSQVQAINKHSDVLMTTYYPLGKDFKVKSPSVVFKDIDRVIELYKDKPVYFLEAGYPSSRFLGSSEAKQAEFIGAMFKAWDRHRKQIKLVNFIWLHDITEAEVKSYSKYYGLSSKGFAAYLGSLGMRTHRGKDKQAFKALRRESKARGW